MAQKVTGYPPLEEFDEVESQANPVYSPHLGMVFQQLAVFEQRLQEAVAQIFWLREFLEVLTPDQRFQKGMAEMKRRAEQSQQAGGGGVGVEEVQALAERVDGLEESIADLPTRIVDMLRTPPGDLSEAPASPHPTLASPETGVGPPDDLGEVRA